MLQFGTKNTQANVSMSASKPTTITPNSSIIAYTISEHAKYANVPLVLITDTILQANIFENELSFFLKNSEVKILHFTDREILPYDFISPSKEVNSERIKALYQIQTLQRGIVIIAIPTLLHFLPPKNFINQHTLVLRTKQKLNIDSFKNLLMDSNYHHVSQIYAHGEFSLRGAIIDIFPSGANLPYRIELFDDEIENIRTFDLESQRTIDKIAEIKILPAHEFALDKDTVTRFRKKWRDYFPGSTIQSHIYETISQNRYYAGCEYYLPFFHEELTTIFNYIHSNAQILTYGKINDAINRFQQETSQRYQQKRHDIEKPIIAPELLFLNQAAFDKAISNFAKLEITTLLQQYMLQNLPNVTVTKKSTNPLSALENFIKNFSKPILFCVESLGRREIIKDLLRKIAITPHDVESISQCNHAYQITIAPLHKGFIIENLPLAIITESELFGDIAIPQYHTKKSQQRFQESIIRDLIELTPGALVVHIEHGIGRYLGLTKLMIDNVEIEFLSLEYADNDKLYVPITNLNQISRYAAHTDHPVSLNKLGTSQWQKSKEKIYKKIRDIAAELLAIYAKRASKAGEQFKVPTEEYAMFCAQFPFETTPDQSKAIQEVIHDLQANKIMDRLICGDVGFGKTEVAMRAAFIVVNNQKQVAILVPTTLLAEQHYRTFCDRFADWPINIKVVSRFKSAKETQAILQELANGKVDIIIGTHRLLQSDIKFKNLGLLIVDEEHRFGVNQKDKIKHFKENIDVLALTATPIPRTLNFSLSGIRDFSIIASPPAKRLAVKTFLAEYDEGIMREAILREMMRGGQVFFIHNHIETINKTAEKIQKLIPDAKIAIAHGQMPESQLEKIMSEFYHQHFHILMSTTIIESGIDIPTANTMIIDNAHRFGLAQLHQLRGRVGRSHHQAYTYLIIPSEQKISAEAEKRLQAFTSFSDLGAGFVLATHDLEIRGAGEILGEEQSGHIEAIGYSLYLELLEQAVKQLKEGKEFTTDAQNAVIDIDIKIPAFIPDEYLPDIPLRLTFYKRIASITTEEELKYLQMEMLDRFGLFSQPIRNLFKISELRITAISLKITKIQATEYGATIEFTTNPPINHAHILTLIQNNRDQYKLAGNQKIKIIFKNLNNLAEIPEILQNFLKEITLVSDTV